MRKKLITALAVICVIVLAFVLLRGGEQVDLEAEKALLKGNQADGVIDAYADTARSYIWPLYEGDPVEAETDLIILQTGVLPEKTEKTDKKAATEYSRDMNVQIDKSGEYVVTMTYVNLPVTKTDEETGETVPAEAEATVVKISVDGASVCEELDAFELPAATEAYSLLLADKDEKTFAFRLSEGGHVINVTAPLNVIQVTGVTVEPVNTYNNALTIDVPENGQYAIVMKYVNDEKTKGSHVIEMTFNGEAPFTEMQAHPLTEALEEKEVLLCDDAGVPYMFCMTAGEHEIRLRASQGGIRVTSLKLLSLQRPVYAGEDIRFEQSITMALGETGEMTIEVPEDARYEMWLDYRNTTDNTMPTEMTVTIDGKVVSEEMQRVKLNSEWVDQYYTTGTRSYSTDRYGNEIAPQPQPNDKVLSVGIGDSAGRTVAPLLFSLEKGKHTIGFSVQDGGVELSALTLKAPVEIPAYVPQSASGDAYVVIEAEEIYSRNESSIRGAGEFSAELSPYSNDNRMINYLDGASFDTAGETVTWKFTAPKTGWYNLGAFYRQSARADFPTYVDVFVDGVIPSTGAQRVAFDYSTSFTRMQAKVNGTDEALKIYLTEGPHTISFRINSDHLTPVYKAVDYLLDEINSMSNDIKALVGGATADEYRSYYIERNFPGIVDRMIYWANMASSQVVYAKQYSPNHSGSAFASLTLCADQLKRLSEEPEELPRRMSEFSTGSNSAARMLAQQLTDMANNDLSIDQIYLYQDEAQLPAKPNFLETTWAGVMRFFSSFTSTDYVAGSTSTSFTDEEGNEHPVIQVWVGRSRQYVELMQQMADDQFFKETGVRVNLSLMPDANKLVLANAAGTAPDAVLGLQYVVPSYLNIRGALYDLSEIDDITREDGLVVPGFGAVAQRFSSGLFIPYTLTQVENVTNEDGTVTKVYDDGIYAMPETVNFWVMFYRKDNEIIKSFGVPDTMEEVKLILPELQRGSMNFYFPTAGMVGTKVFPGTLPLILQSGGTIYGDTIGDTTLDDPTSLEGFRYMTELFTVYNMPIDVPSPGFYQQFRDGTLPIGVADLATYNLLLNAAPELDGLWDIALFPGIKNEQGEVQRWTTGGAETMAIMSAAEDHDRVDEAWMFLEWWSRAETQRKFGNLLQSTYGSEYIWPTANTEAFAQLPLRSSHKQVIIEQMQWMTEAPWVLGTYMLERELSNAFISVTADGVDVRRAMDTAVKRIDRETYRKLEEFGYEYDKEKGISEFKTPNEQVVEGFIERYNQKKLENQPETVEPEEIAEDVPAPETAETPETEANAPEVENEPGEDAEQQSAAEVPASDVNADTEEEEETAQ